MILEQINQRRAIFEKVFQQLIEGTDATTLEHFLAEEQARQNHQTPEAHDAKS